MVSLVFLVSPSSHVQPALNARCIQGRLVQRPGLRWQLFLQGRQIDADEMTDQNSSLGELQELRHSVLRGLSLDHVDRAQPMDKYGFHRNGDSGVHNAVEL